MKKFFTFFLISSLVFSNLFGMAENNLATSVQVLKQKVEEIKDQTKFQKFTSSASAVSENVRAKVKSTFNWVADRIDTILTKKGVIKTLLILGPLFATYCYFFPPEPAQKLIKYIVGSTTQGSAEIAKAALGGLRSNKGEIKELVVEVMQEVGDVQATVKINQEIGEMQAFGASMLTHPIWTGILGLYKVIDAGVKLGVPFILGLWTKQKITGAAKE